MTHKLRHFQRLAAAGFLVAISATFSTTLCAADANSPKSYALRLPITLAPDAPLQRLQLPAQALVQMQSSGYSDVRIFNAQGQPVPMALSRVASSPAERGQVKLSAFPILGGESTTALDGLQLRIEERQGQRVVQLSTATGSASTATPKVLGALLDAREVKTPVVAIVLDVDLPTGQPITFNLQASKDLKNWRQVAETVLFKTDAASLGTSTIELPAQDLSGHYLRVTWPGVSSQLPGVTLRSATLTTAVAGSVLTRVQAAVAPPALVNPHEFSFNLPFATPVAALRIDPVGSNTLVPVRVLGRNDRSQPWAALASTVVYKLTTGGKTQSNGPVELMGAATREIKIEADKKTPGFAAAPEVSVLFDPVQLVFLANGAGPFTLAVGAANLSSAYLPLPSLMPGYQSGQENKLPLATLEASGAGPVIVGSSAASDSIPTRSLVLWGVLIAGALALGAMAWALMKQNSRDAKTLPADNVNT